MKQLHPVQTLKNLLPELGFTALICGASMLFCFLFLGSPSAETQVPSSAGTRQELFLETAAPDLQIRCEVRSRESYQHLLKPFRNSYSSCASKVLEGTDEAVQIRSSSETNIVLVPVER